MTGIREKLLAAFEAEHREYLTDIGARLDRLGEGGALGAEIEEMLRQAHSLKGAARAVDLPGIEAVAHRLEAVFIALRDGIVRFGPVQASAIRQALDAIEDLASAARGGRPVDADSTLSALDAVLRDGPASAPRQTVPAARPPEPPAPQEAASHDAAPARPDSTGTLRLEAARLDDLLRTAGELLAEQTRMDATGRQLGELDREAADLERSWAALRRAIGAAVPAFGTDAEALGLGRLSDAFEQQLRRLRRVGREVRRRHEGALRSARRTGEALGRQLRAARMTPAASVFEGARKMVRDLAADTGKEVAVEIRGLEVQADRLVLQELKDPVMHLLRNAVGHGIEPPEQRRAAGKPPEGRVSLEFRVAGDRLLVIVSDDGRGFDPAEITAAARRAGLIAADEPAPAGADLLELLFSSGFSTREAADSIAGRGIGLSVVREAVHRLDGTAVATRRPDGGARFRLSVPVSALARDVLLVRTGGRIFALPADGIERLMRLEAQAVGSVEGRPAIQIDGRPVRMAGLSALLGLAETSIETTRARMPVVVLGDERPVLALGVDELLGLRNVLVRSLGLPAAPGALAAGGVVLEDGDVAVVLNPAALERSLRRAPTAVETRERAATRRAPVVLVVDDSLTTRTLEKSILEAHGYEVLMAVDGIEGLNRARTERPDVVVTDIQMPRLDGFGLVQAMKQDEALKEIPVVIVSSLDRREERARGLALGADAYVVKQRFDQQALLETIRQLI
ncbi:hybrid sensor histidine kinase/response regulator [Arenibaculum pallidiluteum]|uniref:hybrid sensor histidine kinase/response regulator n=1 Tax=Arenibaculum pallidiluteum TaxID=2812559 RepID=UPI001A95FD7B|nr:response regulator [Arenibaculum pallidiluteum]